MKQQVHLVSLGVSDVAACQAGALVLKNPQRAEWGGYSGDLEDPDGHIWEVASGGVAFDETGRAILG